MEQNEIREFDNIEYSVAEGAAIIRELDLRTKHPESGYNSISELAGKVKGLESDTNVATIENEYADIADLLANQNEQTPGALQYVEDATADPQLPPNPERLYAYYEKLPESTESLDDYRLLGNNETSDIEAGAQKVADQYGNEIATVLKVIYGEGFKVALVPGGGYKLVLFQKPEEGTNINLTSLVPRLYNYAAPLSGLAYVVSQILPGGKAKVLILVDEEPNFTYDGNPCKKLANSFDFGEGLDNPALFEVFLEFNGVDITYFILEY